MGLNHVYECKLVTSFDFWLPLWFWQTPEERGTGHIRNAITANLAHWLFY